MTPTHYHQHELDPFLLGPGKARVTLVVTLEGTEAVTGMEPLPTELFCLLAKTNAKGT